MNFDSKTFLRYEIQVTLKRRKEFNQHLSSFSEVQCVDPLSVKDGFIEVSNFKGRYVFGSLATYHCNPGYILWGNASRLCAENGKWTGTNY